MRLVDTASEALRTLRPGRTRGAMAVVGIVLCIAAVVGLASVLGGVREAYVGEAAQSRARLVNVSTYVEGGMGVSDVRAMGRELSDYFETVSPSSSTVQTMTCQDRITNVMLVGSDSEAVTLLGVKAAHGRFFTRSEAQSGAAVVVLDETSARDLFGGDGAAAIGRNVSVAGVDLEVIGIASFGSSTLPGLGRALVPFETLAQQLGRGSKVDEAHAIVREGVDVSEAADAAEDWLAARLQIPDESRDWEVEASTMQADVDRFDYVSRILMTLMVVGSSLTLVLGGVSVMYLMRATVAERRDEFAWRRALGATRADIACQVVLEALALTLSAGLVGALIGFLGVNLLVSVISDLVVPDSGMLIEPTIGIGAIALVLGICLFIGLVFSSGPAHRAARIDAVEALRGR